MLGGSYSASVFYLALSIIHVFISSLFHIKSELLISLEKKSDSIASLSLPFSTTNRCPSVHPCPHTCTLWTGHPCPSVWPAAPRLAGQVTEVSHLCFKLSELMFQRQRFQSSFVGVHLCSHTIPQCSRGVGSNEPI